MGEVMTQKSLCKTECVCGNVYEGYPNFWGKFCGKCGEFIPPTKKPPMIKENEHKKKLIVKQIRASIRKKFGLTGEEPNANSQRKRKSKC